MELKINDKTIPEMIRELEQQKFYGSLEISFQAGHVTVIRKTESFRPASEPSTEQQFNHRQNRGNGHEQFKR